MADEDRGPRASITIGRKVNDGNYGSYDLSITVSDLYADTTLEEIEQTLQASRMSYSAMVERLKVRLTNLRTST